MNFADIPFPQDLWDKLVREAKREEIAVADLIINILEDYIDNITETEVTETPPNTEEGPNE
jgi:hypothetical protein